MSEALSEAFARLPDYLGGHMRLSLAAIGIAILVSLPLGVIAARRPAIAGPSLGFASVMQTIPALALLALMVPILGGRIGFAPAFVALTLYGVLPILRNTIVGLQGVGGTVMEAARGVGMTPLQSLLRVELPLALPMIVAGVRTATVWVVGAATLATPVGATSLGNYIFAGLQTRNWEMVLFGCVASAGLALLLDQLIRLMETATVRASRGLAGLAGAGLAGVIAGSLAAGAFVDVHAGGRQAERSLFVSEAADGPPAPVVIGSKAFTEQYILAELLARRIEAAGLRAERVENLGSTVAFDALASGEIDVYVDYSGTLWATVLDRPEPIARHAMQAEITAALFNEHRVYSLGPLGFENAYGIAVTRATAEQHDLRVIGDLRRVPGLSLAADPEFFARAEWTRMRDLYGLAEAEPRSMDSTFMYDAVRNGEVDAITAYTTDGRIAAYDLVILRDPLAALPPYDAMVLLSAEAANRPAVTRAISPLINAIGADAMREANAAVDLERGSVREAADRLEAALGSPSP